VHVTGSCAFPSAGSAVELWRHEPQGSNPTDLLLQKVIHVPREVSASVLTTVPVHYREDTAMPYETVTIVPDGVSLTVIEGF
jgi:hypothetical protein